MYEGQPHAHMPLLQAIEEAHRVIEVGSVQGWIRYARRYFPRCLARDDIACDVNEVMWPDPTEGGIHKPSTPSFTKPFFLAL